MNPPVNRPDDKSRPEGRRSGWAAEIGPFLTIGIQLALSVIVFFFLGRWLDGLWDTAPWLMLAGLLVGAAGGFLQFFRAVTRLGPTPGNGKK